jgi:capsular exopolysaccharide synthesis family protein
MRDLLVRLADLKREYARLSTTFKEDYPQAAQVKSQVEELEGLVRQEQENALERVTNDYQAAVQQEELLRQAFRTQEQLMNSVADKAGRYNILKRDVETNRQLYGALQQNLKEAGVSAGLQAANVGILDQATAPRSPDRPKLWLNLALALTVGLVLGVGAGFLREYLDTSVKTPEELVSFSPGLALGMIPSFRSMNGGEFPRMKETVRHALLSGNGTMPGKPDWHRIDGDQWRNGSLSDAFGGLRTSILLGSFNPQTRSLLVSSSQPGEGKTTVSANLAISLAQLRRRTLLIDADVRRPCLHRLFKVPNQAGLTNFLADGAGTNGNGGSAEWRALVRRNVSTGLDLLTSGTFKENPAELLSSPLMSALVNEALLSYDFVLLDSPPLFVNVADARILAPIVDGTVLVVRSGMTPRDVVQRAVAQCSNVVGIVLNDVNVEEFPSYYKSPYSVETVSTN